ncbi:MAG: hypothetical protein K9N09_05935 [Candidatus Cloacimonetes bacterium]|nr:hypothetical protein [Candidatus Cloacimonadota bacterium]MCF7883656.1 hypothetical protein [Candidatus Cloacimonadota bacterium]
MLKKRMTFEILLMIVLIPLLYFISSRNYIFFHTIVELISIIVAFSLFSIAWNSQEFSTNKYLLFLGIAYLFIGSIDLLHTISYKGMNIFPNYDTDLPTQLWITARYMESISLIAASYFFKRKFNTNLLASVYFIVFIMLNLLIFNRLFPVCFVEGIGLTAFKKISEYIISILLLFALWRVIRLKNHFMQKIRWMIYLSIILTIFAEIAFTFYISVYGLSNFVGHIFKLLSFYLIYRALIVTSLTQPYNTLFNNLRISESRYRKAQEIGHVGNWEFNIQTKEFWGSDEAKRIYGFEPASKSFSTDKVEGCIPDRENVHQALVDLIEKEKPYNLEFEIRTYDKGESKYINSIAELERDNFGHPHKVSGVIADITKQKKAEIERNDLLKEKEILLKEVHHRIKNNMTTIESLLRLHRRQLIDSESKSALLDAGNRVKSMRILYDKLFKSDNFRDIHAKDYLSSLIDEVVGVFSQKDKIKIEKDIHDFKISAKLVFPLGIIINELITNVMKYAFPEQQTNVLKFQAEEISGKVRIIIQDNGVGLPEDFNLQKSTGFGLQLVNLLVEQLQAELNIENGNGTKFIIEFNLSD